MTVAELIAKLQTFDPNDHVAVYEQETRHGNPNFQLIEAVTQEDFYGDWPLYMGTIYEDRPVKVTLFFCRSRSDIRSDGNESIRIARGEKIHTPESVRKSPEMKGTP